MFFRIPCACFTREIIVRSATNYDDSTNLLLDKKYLSATNFIF